MKIFKRKPKKAEGKKSVSIDAYLPLIIALASSFLIYFLSKDMKSAFSVLLTGLTVSYLLGEKNEKKKKNKDFDAPSFYVSFLVESGLEKSYSSGFQKAVDSLPISSQKDLFLDYIDSQYRNEFPISDPENNEEKKLIQTLYLVLYNNEEYCYETTNILLNEIKDFQNNQREDSTLFDLVISIVPYLLFFLILAFGVIYHA